MPVGRNRTPDLLITSELLLPLSYTGIGAKGLSRTADTPLFKRVLYLLSYLGDHVRGNLLLRKCAKVLAGAHERRGLSAWWGASVLGSVV